MGPGAARLRKQVVAAVATGGLVLVLVLGAGTLHDLIEGLDRTQIGLWRLLIPVLLLAAAGMAWVARVARPRCAACGTVAPVWLFAPAATDLERRRLLRALGALGAGLGGAVAGFAAAVGRNRAWVPIARDFFLTTVETTAPHPRPEWRTARIERYRRLGRTAAMVSDVSLGSARICDVAIARTALDRGLNYFDTAPDYADAQSERALGEAMRGRRDQVFVATKFCRPDGHVLNDTPVPEIVAAVEASLRRLQTDHVDLVHIHSCDRVDRLLAPNVHEAFDRLKAAGKVRFLGVSTHTPNLEAVANAAIDSGRFDVLMLAYHFGMWRDFGRILEKARAHDVGIVAMKTLKGAKHTNLAAFRDERSSYAQAAFRWVLSNPNVSCLVVSFYAPEHVDEYLAASGGALRPEDTALLERYDRLVAGDYCQPHCGACLDSCPVGLPIDDVLRHRMYAKDYGWPEEGVRRYAALPRNAAACVACPAPCAGACPLGVPIRDAMLDAHRVLAPG
jgi:aryl-alcohol dehydrogenase-like predicted oxidoreductase